MPHENKKISLIINEIISLFLVNGIENIDVKIKRSDEETFLIFKCINCTLDEAVLERLEHNLSTHRQCEVEGYYWNLAGENTIEDQLYLIGCMIDESKIDWNGKNLTIEIVRKNIDS